MSRRYFGTDGVRGVVGQTLTPELVASLGRAAVGATDAKRVLVGRDTRGSGPELESALAAGISAAGATAVLGGVLPTAAVAQGALDLGVVITASHNPPRYNGLKFFQAGGAKLSDAQEEQIERLLEPTPLSGTVRIERDPGAAARYIDYVLERFGGPLDGLRIVVDCGNGAYSGLAPEAFARLGASVEAIGDRPDGSNINVGYGALDTAALSARVLEFGADLGVAFDGDGDRIVAVDEHGATVDGDGILAILALHLGVERVCVTQMSNAGFGELMARHSIALTTTPVGDRYVLEALRREGALLGGEQSGHVIYLDGHVAGDGLTAALLLCGALEGRRLSDAHAVLERYPQATANVAVSSTTLTPVLHAAVAELTGALEGAGRVLVRPSGTEPLVRVLVEAREREEAQRACASIAALVESELG